MYPNQQPGQPQWQQDQPQQQQPTPLQPLPSDFDTGYLDKIAAPTQVKTVNPMVLWGMIAAVLLVVIMFFFMFTSGNKSMTKTGRIDAMQERVQSLKKLTTTNAKLIKSSQLRASNASLSTILTGVDTETSAYLATVTAEKKTKDTKIVSPVASEYLEIDTKLKEAKLNVAFDPSYARQVTNQIAQLRSEMAIIYKETQSDSYKEKLSSEEHDLKKLQADFSDFKTEQ